MRDWPIRWYPGVPPINAFGTVDGKGTPIVIDTTTNCPYYLGPDNVVHEFCGGAGGGEAVYMQSRDAGIVDSTGLIFTAILGGSSTFRAAWVKRGAGQFGKRYWEFSLIGPQVRGYFFGVMAQSEANYASAGAYPLNPFGETFYGVCNGNTLGVSPGRFDNGTLTADTDFDFSSLAITLRFAVDYDAGFMWFGKDTVWVESGDPAGGTLANFSLPSPAFDIFMAVYGGSTTFSARARFAAADFLYTPPAGFLPFL